MVICRHITSELYILELRPILPAVTSLVLLALWLVYPAVTPQHTPPTKWQGPTRATREGLTRGV